MAGKLYLLVCSLGLLIAVFAVGFWCVKFYLALQEGDLRPAVNQLVWPVVLVILLANNGRNMRDLTLASRNVLNGMNQSVVEVISADVNAQKVLQAIFGRYAIQVYVRTQMLVCNEIKDIAAFNACMRNVDVGASLIRGDIKQALQTASPILGARLDRWTKDMEEFQTKALKPKSPDEAQSQAWSAAAGSAATNALGTNTSPAASPAPSASSSPAASPSPSASSAAAAAKPTTQTFDALNSATYNTDASMQSVIDTLLSVRKAFLFILESMMLVTALLGPIFVSLSLFPVGTKPIIAWAVSFLTIGFCKICYSLISGLSAIAMVYAGPKNTDMTVAAVALGLLAPALAFVVASNSGFSALSTVANAAQNSGFNAGFNQYTITASPTTSKKSEGKIKV
jgi:hypothetical protein